jgi:hypothetical protein
LQYSLCWLAESPLGDFVTPVNESAFRGDLAMRSLFDRLVLAVAMNVFRFEVAATAVSLGRLC